MASSSVNMHFDRQNRKGVFEVSSLDAILAQNKLLSQQVTNLTKQVSNLQVNAVTTPPLVCDFCGGQHVNGECQANQAEEHVKAVGQQNNAFSNTYNPGWRNHPNFSWGGQSQQGNEAPDGEESLFRIEVIDSLIHEEFKRGLTKNPLEKALMEGKCAKEVKSEDENYDVLECINQLESLKSLGITNQVIEELKKDEEVKEGKIWN
ncbi:hypothetical protein SESBI_04137 [Sesbania bispinosa]|nr:hypothetical protein SESBI_04137 [Sesbania bispinosa]